MTETHYQVLGVDPSCGNEELRRAYHRAARQSHPDKSGADASSALAAGAADPNAQHQRFLMVQEAYEALRDGERRAQYDQQLARDALQTARKADAVVVSDEIAVGEMQREELDDGEGGVEVVLSYACRCGDVFEVTEDELHDGVDVVPCTGCSQHIRVISVPS